MKLIGLKGQSALEYMVTYGWMLLVVGLVVVVLWQYGVFNPQTTPPGCSGFSQLSPIDHKVSSFDDNVISLTLLNNAGTKIVLNSINVTYFNQMCYFNVNPPLPADMRAGQTIGINVTKAGCSPITVPGHGEYYKAEMTFDYTNIESGIPHLSAGECHGTVE